MAVPCPPRLVRALTAKYNNDAERSDDALTGAAEYDLEQTVTTIIALSMSSC